MLDRATSLAQIGRVRTQGPRVLAQPVNEEQIAQGNGGPEGRPALSEPLLRRRFRLTRQFLRPVCGVPRVNRGDRRLLDEVFRLHAIDEIHVRVVRP